MPTFYNYTQNTLIYSFDDVFVPADSFRQGNLWMWGNNNGTAGSGLLGNNRGGNIVSTPITTFAGGANWKQISTVGSHTTAIKTDGTLWTWGYNGFGQLGVNDGTNRSTPVTTFLGGNDWKQVAAGYRFTAAIKIDGTLWTWGYNASGNLGINLSALTTGRTTPVTTFAGGTNWKQVSCGQDHVAAIKTDGTLWTWGSGGQGQLGDNTSTNRCTPVTTFAGGANWKQVGGGSLHTAAIKTDGTLWVWGQNANAALGDNTTVSRSTPVTTFAGGTNWKQVSSGNASCSASIKTDGTLWVWGNNASGNLGTNDTNGRTTPVTTFAGGNNWKQVSCSDHMAAIKTDGTLWTWGKNTQGQLGNNSIINSSTPVTTFLGGTNWKQLFCGRGDNMGAITYFDDYV